MSRNLTRQQVEQIITLTARAVAKKKAEWMDSQMQRVMPPELYAIHKSTKLRDRNKLRKWISHNKVELREHPLINETPNIVLLNGPPGAGTSSSLTEMVMGEQVISEFRVRHKDGKIQTMSRDYPLEITCS